MKAKLKDTKGQAEKQVRVEDVVFINPALMLAVMESAKREHRSISNMIEMMIIGYCRINGIPFGMEPIVRKPDEVVGEQEAE